MTAEAAQIKTMPCGKSLGANRFRYYNGALMTEEAILALHIVDLDDKVACVTRFYPDFAGYPPPAQKAVLDLSYQGVAGWVSGDFKPAIVVRKCLTAADSRDKAARQSIQASPAAK